MSWDRDKAVAYLRAHALKHSSGRCAHYVREAIAAGGVAVEPRHSAKEFGPSLTRQGFAALPGDTTPQPGDVAIIQAIPGHPDGHACMWDGKQWISDFRQLHGLYPSQAYRDQQPAITIYRHQ